jgi:DNA topoisomerase-1
LAKKAIIVESPAKTRTLGRFLGADYTLLATRGHIRDLPGKGLAVDVEHDFRPEYEIIPRQKKTIAELAKALKGVDEVYLASDPDREGEAIAWHLTQALKLPGAQRIEFNEITEQAVREALAHPRAIDQRRVDAQQARRVLDRLVGYEISPLLWRTMARSAKGASLSAGRVQSVALRLVVEREREILAFVPEEYWSIEARLTPQDREAPFSAELKQKSGEKIAITSQAEAEATVEDLRRQEYVVGQVEEKDRKRNPLPSFITSTMQRAAASELSFSASKTMQIAQELYEGVSLGGETVGLITYMRTDSTRVAAPAQEQAQEYIQQQFGKEYLGAGVRGKAVKGAQEAHECIRPTSVFRTPQELAAQLDRDQARLYELIWRRFMASRMAPALLHQTGVDILAGPYTLRAAATRVVFPGFLAVLPDREEDEAKRLPELIAGQALNLLELLPEQHFTQPPPRYNEASLVQALEENGIGRPSTYAPTLETLRARSYVTMEKRQFLPTRLGFAVCDYLLDHFPNIMDVEFTARMEQELDSVEAGKLDWVALLREFYTGFETRMTEVKTGELQELEGESCPECGGKLTVRYSGHGKFAGCENYPECKYTRDLSGYPTAEQESQPLEEACPECGAPLMERRSRFGPFVGCSAYPKCKYIKRPEGQAERPAPKILEESCPECGSPLAERPGRYGPFVGCSAYPKCKYIKPREGGKARAQKPRAIQTDLPCEDCGKPLALRQGRRGPFLGCSGYPKCRFTREATAEELARFTPAEAEGGEPAPEEGSD